MSNVSGHGSFLFPHTYRRLVSNEVNITYAAFGLLLRCNIELPELTPVDPGCAGVRLEESDSCTVIVHMKGSSSRSETVAAASEELSYAGPYSAQAGDSALKIWKARDGRYLRLAYFDGTQFWLDPQGTQIWVTWPDDLTAEHAAAYLLGPVLGLLLRIRGVTCLHASAVAFGEKAVAFVGSAGAGKSTTAAALARRGHAVLSDDVVTLADRGGTVFVHPAYPFLHLWPESVEWLYGSAEMLPRFIPNYEKRCLSLGKRELRFEDSPLPLTAIYILGERRGDPAPILEEITPQRAFLALVANTYATNAIERSLRAKEFEVLGRLVPRIRIRQLCAHQDVRRISDLCDLIFHDMEETNLRKSTIA
ncbi:MAG: hypothetical protein WAN14_02335 [Candidatus Acidiferrales bacterium]